MNDPECEFKNYSRISLFDIQSGKTLPAERDWLDKHPFSDKVKPIDHLEIKSYNSEIVRPDSISTADLSYLYFSDNPNTYSDPETRPFKIISYYVFYDEYFFNDLRDVTPDSRFYHCVDKNKSSDFGVMAWAWFNPDGTTKIGHSLFSIPNFEQDFVQYNQVSNRKIFPTIGASKVNVKEPIFLLSVPEYSLPTIYKDYPKISPLESVKEWASTTNMPAEAETKLFAVFSNVSEGW